MLPVLETESLVFVGVLQEQDVVEGSAVQGVQVAVEGSLERGTTKLMGRLARRLMDEEVANETVNSEHLVVLVVWVP
jgi:hypothetical protein